MIKTSWLFTLAFWILLIGCQKSDYYSEEGELVKMGNECITEIICQIPNSTEEVTHTISVPPHEMCYDLVNDPLNQRGYVNKVMSTHPDDWEDYMNWTAYEHDPQLIYVINNSVEEITCVNSYIERSSLE